MSDEAAAPAAESAPVATDASTEAVAAPESAPVEASDAAPVAGNEAPDAGDVVEAIEAQQDGPITRDQLRELFGERQAEVTVNGETQLVSADEFFDGHMRHRGATKKFQEAAGARKEAEAMKSEVENVFAQLKANPMGVMEALGIDLNPFAEEVINKRLNWESMPEHERQQHKLSGEREAFNKERDEFESAKNERALTAETQRVTATLQESMPKALEGAGITPDAAAIGRMAYHMETALDGGWQMDPAEAAGLVAEEQGERRTQADGRAKERLEGMSGEELYNHLGPERVKALAQYNISRAQTAQQTATPAARPRPNGKAPVERQTWAQRFGER